MDWCRQWMFVGDVLDGAWKGTVMNSKRRSSGDEDPHAHAFWDCLWCAGSSPLSTKPPRVSDRHITEAFWDISYLFNTDEIQLCIFLKSPDVSKLQIMQRYLSNNKLLFLYDKPFEIAVLKIKLINRNFFSKFNAHALYYYYYFEIFEMFSPQ